MTWLRPRLPLSQEGVLWLLASLGVLVTGLLKGINLITLLGCWMATLVLLNYFWARPQLRFLSARRLFPEPAFANTPCNVLIQIENSGKKTCFGIAVQDAGFAHRQTRFISFLPVGARANLGITLESPRRGKYRLEPIRLTTGYPLGLVQLAKPMAECDEIVVFPKLGSLKRGPLRRFLAQHSPTQGQALAYPRRHPGAQTEFHGLRPFRAGDSPRWIHWRTTARRGELMVREFEDMPSDHLVLIVDAGLPDDPLVERLLSLAATICWQWCRQKGDRLALAVFDESPSVLVGTTGDECAYAMLRRLAFCNPSAAESSAERSTEFDAADLPSGPILVVTSRESGLAHGIAQRLHRPVAELNLSRGDDKDFFD